MKKIIAVTGFLMSSAVQAEGLTIRADTYMEFGVVQSTAYIDRATHKVEKGMHGTVETGVKLFDRRVKVYAAHSSSLNERFDKGVSQVGVKLVID